MWDYSASTGVLTLSLACPRNFDEYRPWQKADCHFYIDFPHAASTVIADSAFSAAPEEVEDIDLRPKRKIDESGSDEPSNFNGERIRQAREISGMTQMELAMATGVSQAQIALFEQNLRTPTDDSIGAIAFATKFPVKFFRQESGPDFPLGSLLYRRGRKMSSRDSDTVRQVGRVVFEAIVSMADRFRQIDLRIPRLTNVDPDVAAKMTRAELGLSPDMPITNLVTRLEKNGVIVASIPYDIEEHDAYSVWADTEPRVPVIVMTSGKPGDRQRWSVAHELGHLVMHYSYSGNPTRLESDADLFASEFLLPEVAMRKDLPSPLTLTALADLKARWGVSIHALIMAAYRLEIISDGQRRYLYRQMTAKGWMKQEPVPIPPEKPRLLRKLAETLYGPNFKASDIADPLGLPLSMIAPILDSYATITDIKQTKKAADFDDKHATPRERRTVLAFPKR